MTQMTQDEFQERTKFIIKDSKYEFNLIKKENMEANDLKKDKFLGDVEELSDVLVEIIRMHLDEFKDSSTSMDRVYSFGVALSALNSLTIAMLAEIPPGSGLRSQFIDKSIEFLKQLKEA